MIDLPGKVSKLRQELGMTLAELAALTKVSPVTIHNIERGVYEPRISTLLELCRALSVPISYFVDSGEEFLFFKSRDGSPPNKKYITTTNLGLPHIRKCTFEANSTQILPARQGEVVIIQPVFGELNCSCSNRKSHLFPGDTLYVQLFDPLTLEARMPVLCVILSYSSAVKFEGE